MEPEEYWFWLCGKKAITRSKIQKLLCRYGSVQEIYSAKETELYKCGILTSEETVCLAERKRNEAFRRELKQLQQAGILFLYPEHPAYPGRLKRLTDFPYSLYVRGMLPPEAGPSVGIVGARVCSNYGRNTARELGKEAALYGISVISGMARGIDTYAHSGALAGGGKTWAVLGCGIDICYPKENKQIYEMISQKGGILSEYPPGTPPLPILFPQRNRIISGLSDAVVVVEAREKSGSLITVECALEQGKDVYAVPGRIGDALSAGCNRLIQSGAGILTKPSDLAAVFENTYRIVKTEAEEQLFSGNKRLLQLYNLIEDTPQTLDWLQEKMGLRTEEMFPLLLQLQIKGYIKEFGKNCYARIKK